MGIRQSMAAQACDISDIEQGPTIWMLQRQKQNLQRSSQEERGTMSADADLQHFLVSFVRLRRLILGSGSVQLLAEWISAEKPRAFVIAASWFAFCWFGYFPPSLWVTPIYFWLLLFLSGLVAQRSHARKIADMRKASAPMSQYLAEVLEDPHNEMDARQMHIRLLQEARNLAPIFRGMVIALERIRHIFTFVDCPASLFFFTGVGAICLLMSFTFFIITRVVGEAISTICGVYGVILILLPVIKRAKAQQTSPPPPPPPFPGMPPHMVSIAGPQPNAITGDFLSLRRLGAALSPPMGPAGVPDEAWLLHRSIAESLATDASDNTPLLEQHQGTPERSGRKARFA